MNCWDNRSAADCNRKGDEAERKLAEKDAQKPSLIPAETTTIDIEGFVSAHVQPCAESAELSSRQAPVPQYSVRTSTSSSCCCLVDMIAAMRLPPPRMFQVRSERIIFFKRLRSSARAV